MSLPASVEAVKNERTEKLFIVLDWDVGDNKLKVINPTGDVLDVVKLIFKMDERITVHAANFHTSFSPQQISKLDLWERERFAYEEKKRLERSARTSQSSRSASSSKGSKPRAASTRKEGLIDKHTSSAGKRAAVQWNSSELTFYRHHIEKLKPNDVFAVVVEGQGTFQMTKAEFQRVFNNVIMNADYRTQGVYRYDEIPEEAKAFLR